VQVSALGHVAQHSIAALGHRQIEVLLRRFVLRGQAPGCRPTLEGKRWGKSGKIPDKYGGFDVNFHVFIQFLKGEVPELAMDEQMGGFSSKPCLINRCDYQGFPHLEVNDLYPYTKMLKKHV